MLKRIFLFKYGNVTSKYFKSTFISDESKTKHVTKFLTVLIDDCRNGFTNKLAYMHILQL